MDSSPILRSLGDGDGDGGGVSWRSSRSPSLLWSDAKAPAMIESAAMSQGWDGFSVSAFTMVWGSMLAFPDMFR